MLKNSLLSLVSKFSNIGFKLFLTIFIARILGPSGFGTYNIYLSCSAAITLIFLFGSHNVLLKRSSNISSLNKYNKIFQKYYILLTILVTILSLLLLIMVHNVITASIISMFIGSQFLYFAFQYQFMALNKYQSLIFYNIVYYIVIVCLSISLQPNQYLYYLMFYTIGGIISITFFGKVLLPRNLSLKKKDILFLKAQFRNSKKNFTLDVSSIVQQRLDFFVLYFFGSAQIAGIYAAVKNITESILYLPRSIQPVIIQEKNTEKVFYSIRIVNYILMIVVLLGILSSNFLLENLYGESYSSGNIIFKISLISIYIYSLIILLTSEYIRTNDQSNAIKKNIIVLVITIIIFSILSVQKDILFWISLGVLSSYILLFVILGHQKEIYKIFVFKRNELIIINKLFKGKK